MSHFMYVCHVFIPSNDSNLLLSRHDSLSLIMKKIKCGGCVYCQSVRQPSLPYPLTAGVVMMKNAVILVVIWPEIVI